MVGIRERPFLVFFLISVGIKRWVFGQLTIYVGDRLMMVGQAKGWVFCLVVGDLCNFQPGELMNGTFENVGDGYFTIVVGIRTVRF